METVAIVPGYNPGEKVKKVLTDIKWYVKKIIYIDDGSTDESLKLVKEVPGIRILTHKQNKGKGYAMATGIDYFLKHNQGEVIVFIDSDGQHSPKDIPKLLSAQAKTNADIVIGGRMRDREDMPLLRQFSNKLSSLFISLAARCRIADSQSGYRLVCRSVLEKVPWKPGRYEAETDFIISAARQKFKIVTTPIETIYSDEIRSYFNGFKDTLLIAGVIFKKIW